MARACVNKSDIVRFKNSNQNFSDGLKAYASTFIQIEDAIKKCNEELYNDKSNMQYLISTLEVAFQKKLKLKTELQKLQAELKQLEASLAAALDPIVIMQIQAEIARVVALIQVVQQKLSVLVAAIRKLEDTKLKLNETIRELDEIIRALTKTLNDLRYQVHYVSESCSRAFEALNASENQVNMYHESTYKAISYKASEHILLQKGINNEYAGKLFDYKNLLDKYEETKNEVILELYKKLKATYKVSFSDIDKYGNANPLFEKYEFLHVTVKPVSKENIKNGTCFIGDSSSSSPDFKLCREELLKQGYTRQQIMELERKSSRHHDFDGVTMRYVPRIIHENIKHFGGASNIRIERAIEGI